MDRSPEPPFVEVVYALPARQRVVKVPLAAGMTVLEAVRASGILEEFPELGSGTPALGIWGRRVEATQLLRADDRVEIYRPLRFDPRDARRRAVATESGRKTRGKDRRST